MIHNERVIVVSFNGHDMVLAQQVDALIRGFRVKRITDIPQMVYAVACRLFKKFDCTGDGFARAMTVRHDTDAVSGLI